MSDDSLIEIVILAAVAAFFVFKLRSVLGKRTGHEKPDFDPFKQRKGDGEGDDDKVIQLPDRGKGVRVSQDELLDRADGEKTAQETAAEKPDAATDDNPVTAGIAQIRRADRDFDPDQFVAGARGAFEIVIAAFADGDSKTLRPLLANDVYGDFSGAIKERESRNENLETTLIGITTAEIIESEMQQKTAFVTVKFVSEQVNVTRDSEGRIVDGDPNEVTKITDIWTFARNTRSRDPNWSLVATRSPN